MPLIKCTQKLLKELHQAPTCDIVQKCILGSWHANIFLVERRKCVLATNDLTLYAMFIPCLTKSDFKAFHIVFGQNLFKNLLYENLQQKEIEMALDECRQNQFGKSDNRSVLGSMNEQKIQLECMIQDEGGLGNADIYKINSKLNRNLFSAVGYRYPVELLKEKLQKIA